MSNIYNLKDKLNEMFGTKINKNTISMYVDTICVEFSYDFPQIRSIFINTNGGGDLYRVNIANFDKDFISTIGYVYGNTLKNINIDYYICNYDIFLLPEKVTLEIYTKFLLFSLSSQGFIQPIIDSTEYLDTSNGNIIKQDFININSRHLPVLLFYLSKRGMTDILLNGIEIEHNIYSILEDYVIYKIIDYLFLENVEQITNRIIELQDKNQELMVKLLDTSSDIWHNDNQYVSSINLGGVSMSFDNNVNINTLREVSGIMDKLINSTRSLMNDYKEYFSKIRNDRYKGFINKKKAQLFGLSSIYL